jgi:hypothetical protein
LPFSGGGKRFTSGDKSFTSGDKSFTSGDKSFTSGDKSFTSGDKSSFRGGKPVKLAKTLKILGFVAFCQQQAMQAVNYPPCRFGYMVCCLGNSNYLAAEAFLP